MASCRFLPCAICLVGCAPTLDQVPRATQAFAVAQRCSQGPFELHVPAFGSRWGEDVTVDARGGAIAGHSTIDVDEHHIADETVTNGTVDASACTLSDADRAASSAAGREPGGAASSATTNTGAAGSGGSDSSVAGSVKLLEAGIPNTWIYKTEIAHYHNEVNDWAQVDSVLKHGADMKIVFWSERPLDLQNTIFVVTHSEMLAPGRDDKKWQAHLDDVRADQKKAQTEADAKARKDQAEAEAKATEEARCAGVQGPDKRCHSEGIKTASEQAAYADFEHKCEEMARRNATDQACRDDGWRNDNERPNEHAADLQPTATAITPPTPTRPPPAPQAETQTPRPSVHAEWVPGSWQWTGSDWAWLGGGWRVPEQDRQQGLTATAPSAPPAARLETRPPQPMASAVWADGYWHYDNGQWVWVAGHWAAPPRVGATWRPSTWVQDGVRLRLDPGGWR